MKEQIQSAVKLPAGVFCGNCNGCRFAEWYDKKDDGRVHCGVGYGYNRPSDRNGCFKYQPA